MIEIESIDNEGLVKIKASRSIPEFKWEQLKVVPGELSKPADVAVKSINQVRVDEEELWLKLEFKKPSAVSMYKKNPELLTLYVNGKFLAKNMP